MPAKKKKSVYCDGHIKVLFTPNAGIVGWVCPSPLEHLPLTAPNLDHLSVSDMVACSVTLLYLCISWDSQGYSYYISLGTAC